MTDLQPDLLGDLPSDGVASRAAALAILAQVLGQKKMLDSVLERENSFTRLPPRDRGFVRMLVATVLRRRGQLDDLLLQASDKGELPRPEQLKWILYIGIAQILFMDVADHAAVNTSVDLAASEGMEGKKGFVNAILRRMTGEGRDWLKAQDAAALNIPEWIYTQWINGYGAMKAKEIAENSLNEAALDVTIKNTKEESLWAGALDAGVLPTGSLRRTSGGHVTDLPGYNDGAWWIQDASSALPAKLFGDITGKTVLDLCAAPGGKTAQLAALGANVVAADRSAARMAILRENLRRLKLDGQVQTMIEDGSVWKPREKFDAILLDAPCSATGTIRRHPDLPLVKKPADLAPLVELQAALLDRALGFLKPGGRLVYCTCSLLPDEGESQIEAALARHPGLIAETPALPLGRATPEGGWRTLPHDHEAGIDGFYMARLRRAAP